MSTRNHVFGSPAMALLAALAAGTALALAPSVGHSAQTDTTGQAAYSSNPSSSDRSDSSSLTSSPGQSSEQSMQPYTSSDNADANAPSDSDASAAPAPDGSSNDASAPPDSDDSAAAPDSSSDEDQTSESADMHRMDAHSPSDYGVRHVTLNTTNMEPAQTVTEPAVETTDASTSDTSIDTPSSTASTVIVPSSETAQPTLPPAEPPAIVGSPDEPRYTPETGDAEYGSKLDPERQMPPAALEPPARFNDATGQ